MLNNILQNIGEGIITTSADGVVNYVNPFALNLTGLRESDIVGKELSTTLKLKDTVTGKVADFPLLDIAKPVKNRNHSILVTGNNEKNHISYDISPIFKSGKKKVSDGFVIIIRDLEEAKKIKAESELKLQKSNEELEQFIYIASHDLQEPLRMVASYVQLLERRYKGKLDSDADEFINYTVSGVNKMKNILNDLLSYSRLNTKREEFTLTDLNIVVKGIADNIISKSQIDTEFVIESLPPVKCYASQIMQLFFHLMDNAVKFNEPGSRNCVVTVSSERTNEGVEFSIKDTGIGIDSKYSEKIFAMFQKLHSSKEYPGTGVGLSLCRKIVENHGGRIWFESDLGSGSTFHFTLKDSDGEAE